MRERRQTEQKGRKSDGPGYHSQLLLVSEEICLCADLLPRFMLMAKVHQHCINKGAFLGRNQRIRSVIQRRYYPDSSSALQKWGGVFLRVC